MRTRRAIELTLGIGLLLGPLVYALTLTLVPAGEADAPPCVAVGEAGEARELVIRCEQPEPSEPAAAPEPAPAPEPEELAPEPAPEPAPVELASFVLVADVGLVLSTDAQRSWGTGRLFEPEGTATFRAAKRGEPSTIPAEHLAQLGRTFDLFGADGKVCTVGLGELRVVAQYDGDTLGGVLGDDWEARDSASASPAQIRAGLWQRDDLWLVATFESNAGDANEGCEGALWARDAVLPPPVILRRSAEPTAASATRLANFAQSEQRAKLERDYRETHARLLAEDPEHAKYNDDWDTMAAEHPATAWSWLDGDGQPALVGLSFGRSSDACGDPYEAEYTALEHVEGEAFVASGERPEPVTIIDADLDGQFEFFYTEYHHRRIESATLGRSLTVEQDFYCPC